MTELDQDKVYKCDECDATFKRNEMKFIEPSDNISILTPLSPFIYADKDGNPIGGSEQPSKEKGDKILACPKCGQIHLYGFDLIG